MYQISKHERKMLYRQAAQARFMARAFMAFPYAAAVVALVCAGMWVLQ